MPGRNGQVSRVYCVLTLLEGAPHGLTVKELTDRACERGHKASERTVRRDLDALSAAGFPLNVTGKSDDNAQRWALDRVARVNEHFVLTARELLALYLARGALTPLKDTPFYADLDSIFAKIDERLGARHHEHLDELSSELRFEPGPRWGLGLDPDTLETVRSSCTNRQVLKVRYYSASAGTDRVRRLGPHYLYFAKGSLFLVAEDLDDSGIKIFSLARMKEAEMLDEQYAKEPVDPEAYFKSSFGIYHGTEAVKVQVEFSPKLAPYIKERRWHESQTVVSKAGGSILVTLEVAITPELVQWVLGFGPDAFVLSPPELAKKITEAAAGVVAKYQSPKAA